MYVAVIVAVIVAIAAVLGLVAFFMLRARRSQDVAHVASGRMASIDTVGVGASDESPARVGDSASSVTGKVGESLQPRFVAMGVLAGAVFGSLAVRLWSMQVLNAESFRQDAAANKYAVMSTPAPRGYIYDADGIAIVKNRAALTVLADADAVNDRDVVKRLSSVLGVPENIVRQRLQDTSSGAQSQRVVASDARLRDVAFIAEHADAFPGVSVQERSIRNYPYGALCSHVVGYTGTVTSEALASMPENRDVESGDDVGQSGVEARYDNYLAGEHGTRTVVADADGNVVEIASETAPTRGSDVYLTIKAPVQYVAEEALRALIAPNGTIGEGTGVAGGVVAMDVTDGSILCMASFPTYAPQTFIGGISQDTWDLYSSESSYYPLLNRCIQGTYPAASTFKAFTGLAALKYGFADTETTWVCTGSWDGFGSGDVQKCWLESGHGTIDFHEGIVQSCDVVFYEIAKSFFFAGTTQGGTISDTAMQEEIARFGFGQESGIDLSGEEEGRIPTPAWKAEHWADVPTAGQWVGGDMTNMAIGQGDVLVTPLQVAVAYGGVATGRLMRPHVLKEVRNTTDRAAVSFEPEVVSEPDVDARNLATMRDALNGVAQGSSVLVSAFSDAGIDVADIACKTGTGEVAGKDDYAWFVCYYPFDDPKYVVAVMIEQGGGGAAVAGPIGAQVMGAIVANAAGNLSEVGAVAASSGESVEYTGSSASTGRTD